MSRIKIWGCPVLLLLSMAAMKQTSAQCPTAAPIISNDATNYSAANSLYSTPCGSNTADLSGLTASNTPGSAILTWHGSTPASNANRIDPVENVGFGTRKLYAAFYNAANNCYSPTKQITIHTSICATNDDYSATPVPPGTNSVLASIFINDTYDGNGFTMPFSLVGFAYETWNTSYATVQSDGSIQVLPAAPVGTHTFYYRITDRDSDAIPGANFRIGQVIIVVGSPTLPVNFGDIVASVKNNTLMVDWTTLSETNNDHFDVEVSSNGKDFNKVGTIQSKATSGNTAVHNYTFSIGAGASGVLSLSLLGFIGFVGFRKRSYKLFSVALIAFSAIGLYSCTKSDSGALDNNSQIFVRIAQVDKDGKSSYSKVVKAIY